MTIQVLVGKGVGNREVARKLGITEGTVRYQRGRLEEGREDGRCFRPHREEPLLPQVKEWFDQQGESPRPANIRDLHDHLGLEVVA